MGLCRIDKSIIFMVLCFVGNGAWWYNSTAIMNEQEKSPVQVRLATLQSKGWTLAALSDELEQTVNTLEKWKAGQRNPANEKAVLAMLEQLEKRRRIPKGRRYAKGSRKRETER